MEKNQVILDIIDQCEDENSFLVQLRVFKSFDSNRFQNLVNAISQYKTLLESDENISRRVVNCLFHLIDILEYTMEFYDQNTHSGKQQVEDAHARIWELVTEILNPVDTS